MYKESSIKNSENKPIGLQIDTVHNGSKDGQEDQIMNKAIKEPIQNKNLNNDNKRIEENKTSHIDDKIPKGSKVDTEEPSNVTNIQEEDSEGKVAAKQGTEKAMPKGDKDTARLVKEQISIKTSQLKDIIKNLIDEKTNLKPEAYDKFVQNIKGNINDFKVFNSVSNQYYYLDMPLNIRNNEYDCKLMIKDDRKKGKNIDTKDVKLVVTVSTGNMGTVDSYIKVNNKNINIDIKCEEVWVKFLDLSKDKILKGLENSGYSIHISVEKKEEEANLTNCADFFNDVSISSINTRV
jgi:hypothetical protein